MSDTSALVAMREACAKVADEMVERAKRLAGIQATDIRMSALITAENIAAAIRALPIPEPDSWMLVQSAEPKGDDGSKLNAGSPYGVHRQYSCIPAVVSPRGNLSIYHHLENGKIGERVTEKDATHFMRHYLSVERASHITDAGKGR